MATAQSLQGLDWIVRTYGPALLIACDRAAGAAALAGSQTINSTARLNAAITRVNTLEAQLKVEYSGALQATWDAAWQQALDKVDAEISTTCPVPLSGLLADADTTVKTALKTAMRGLELVACKFLADGGVFP